MAPQRAKAAAETYMSGYDFVVTKPFDNPHTGIKQKIGDHVTDQDVVAKLTGSHHATYGVRVPSVGKLDKEDEKPADEPTPVHESQEGEQGQLQLPSPDGVKQAGK